MYERVATKCPPRYRVVMPTGDLETLPSSSTTRLLAVMNSILAVTSLKPLAWAANSEPEPHLRGTHPDREAADGEEHLCAAWAKLLGLAEPLPNSTVREGHGFSTGTAGTWTYAVSCISDQSLFDRTYPSEDDGTENDDSDEPR